MFIYDYHLLFMIILIRQVNSSISVNVDSAIEIGNRLHDDQKVNWPEGFNDRIKDKVVAFSAN